MWAKEFSLVENDDDDDDNDNDNDDEDDGKKKRHRGETRRWRVVDLLAVVGHVLDKDETEKQPETTDDVVIAVVVVAMFPT